jgi:hypothetical protein
MRAASTTSLLDAAFRVKSLGALQHRHGLGKQHE